MNSTFICRGCQRTHDLKLAEFSGIADGCPCNSPRGINHGLVPKHVCTCDECDPARTGATRPPDMMPVDKRKDTT